MSAISPTETASMMPVTLARTRSECVANAPSFAGSSAFQLIGSPSMAGLRRVSESTPNTMSGQIR